jgi:hypothetical protein
MAPPQPGDPGSTTTDQADVRRLVERYVDQLKAAGAVRSPAVERAFRTVLVPVADDAAPSPGGCSSSVKPA